MFDFMADRAPDEDFTVEADPTLEADTPALDGDGAEGGERPAWLQAHMSEYQKQRQNVYDRTLRLLRRGKKPPKPKPDSSEPKPVSAAPGATSSTGCRACSSSTAPAEPDTPAGWTWQRR